MGFYSGESKYEMTALEEYLPTKTSGKYWRVDFFNPDYKIVNSPWNGTIDEVCSEPDFLKKAGIKIIKRVTPDSGEPGIAMIELRYIGDVPPVINYEHRPSGRKAYIMVRRGAKSGVIEAWRRCTGSLDYSEVGPASYKRFYYDGQQIQRIEYSLRGLAVGPSGATALDFDKDGSLLRYYVMGDGYECGCEVHVYMPREPSPGEKRLITLDYAMQFRANPLVRPDPDEKPTSPVGLRWAAEWALNKLRAAVQTRANCG
ncbi:MAG: hypothetical protein PHY92_01140 [Alphaproteobacteria bacterium]|nr:hypothetical protein [Alphaproteobacteria bacterium]